MVKIILDTNFLLIPTQYKVDIFSEIENISGNFELFVIDKTNIELDKIISKGGKDKIAAKVGKELLKIYKVKIIESDDSDYVDDAIIKSCNEDPKIIVATSDIGLKKRLKGINIKTIELRQKKYLILN